MTSNTRVERTAKSAFTLEGQPVGKGQIVSLDPFQLNDAAAKGCVALTHEENARVPRAELPAFVMSEPPELIEARRVAANEIDALQLSVANARTKAADEIAGIERQTTERLQSLGRDVTEAEAARDARIREITTEVAAAEADAQEKIAAAEKAASDAADKGASETGGSRARRQSGG